MTITVDKEIDRILTLLRNKIRERGFTQLQVQAQLEWGRSYISQLLTKQKSLRVEQVLLILDVIGVDPADFYGELYRFPTVDVRHEDPYAPAHGRAPYNAVAVSTGEAAPGWVEEMRTDLRGGRLRLEGLVKLLIEKEIIDPEELAVAA
ncbi:MAG: helix-turn-helix transcriptional regulator, partial [Acidobacteriota bacterium]